MIDLIIALLGISAIIILIVKAKVKRRLPTAFLHKIISIVHINTIILTIKCKNKIGILHFIGNNNIGGKES